VIPLAIGLALAAAGLHAVWNVLLKTSGDPLQTSARAMGSSALVVAPLAALAWLAVGRPALPPRVFLLVGLSSAGELAYFIFLSQAYREGELSVVYPLARGTAPLLAVLAGLVILHERLSNTELAGVFLLLAGIWSVRRPVASGRAVRPALLTGVCIASYSAVDRVGVQLVPPWLYGAMIWTGAAVLLTAWVSLRHRMPRRGSAGPVPGIVVAWRRDAVIGLFMTVAYLLVLVALSVAPLAVVAPLRESAIVVVTLWSVWRLGERQKLRQRLGGAGAILLGAIALALHAT
jgi:drug/metabolite transporter (DMT)-like permease